MKDQVHYGVYHGEQLISADSASIHRGRYLGCGLMLSTVIEESGAG